MKADSIYSKGHSCFKKRGYYGTFHHVSVKHLHRYVSEFVGRHNVRDKDTIDQMQDLVAGMVGKRLMYSQLIAD